MLEKIRKGKENAIYSFIILAVIAVMALFGVDKMNQRDSNGDGPAAFVNGEIITQREFRQTLEYKLMQYQSMLGNQYDERLLSALQIPQKTLEELIQYKLLSQQANQLGIYVPDQELADHIKTLPMYQKDGKFDAETYSKLPNRGLEEKQRRERLQTLKFQNYLSDRVKVTPEEIKHSVLVKETKVDIDYAKIDVAALAPKRAPSAKELADFIAATPEADLKAHYEGHKSDFTEKEAVRLRQIRIGIPFKAKDEVKADAKKKIDLIAKELTAANFEEIAKQKSDDEYAKKGGNRGWMTRGTLEKPLEDAIDKLPLNEVSPVVETPFGYFILQALEKKAAVTRPFEEVKQIIATTLWSESSKKQFTENQVKQWEAQLAQGKSIEADLKQRKVELKKTGAFSLGQGYIPNIGQVDSMVDAIFQLTKDSPVAKKLYYFQDHYYFLKLRTMELPKEADAVKTADTVERGIITSLQGEVITGWIKDLEKKSKVKTELAFEKNAPNLPIEN